MHKGLSPLKTIFDRDNLSSCIIILRLYTATVQSFIDIDQSVQE